MVRAQGQNTKRLQYLHHTQTPFNIICSLISWNSTLNYYNLYYIFDSVTSTDFSKRHDQLLRHLQLSQQHLLINL